MNRLPRNQMKALPALLLAISLALPAHAETPPPPPPAEGLPFSAFMSEDDMRLLFDYMRDAIIAAMKGEEYRMPPELAHKLAKIQQRLMEQGNAAVRQMMEMMQKDLERALEELKPPPPEPVPERTRY